MVSRDAVLIFRSTIKHDQYYSDSSRPMSRIVRANK